MSDPYLGEIRIFTFPFAPKGWTMANGQTMAIQQNQALFALLGTMYGGNGTTTFLLPNLQSRIAIGFGVGYVQGQADGEAAHTLTTQEMPVHLHTVNANNAAGTLPSPVGNYWASDSNRNTIYGTTSNVLLSPSAIGIAGGSQPHPNMMPYTTLNFCIALQGIFPSRN